MDGLVPGQLNSMHVRIILFKIAFITLGAFSLLVFAENMISFSISPEAKDRAIAVSIFFALLARIAQAQYHADRAMAQARAVPPVPPASR